MQSDFFFNIKMLNNFADTHKQCVRGNFKKWVAYYSQSSCQPIKPDIFHNIHVFSWLWNNIKLILTLSNLLNKSLIQETLNISTNADRRTDTKKIPIIVSLKKKGFTSFFYLCHRRPIFGIRPSTRSVHNTGKWVFCP